MPNGIQNEDFMDSRASSRNVENDDSGEVDDIENVTDPDDESKDDKKKVNKSK